MTVAKWLALLLVAVTLLTLDILAIQDTRAVFEHDLLLSLLNTLFAGFIPIVVACVAAQTHVKTGSATILLMGCGMLSFGLCAISAGWLRGASDGANLNVTIYNTGAFFGSLFHAMGAALSLTQRPSLDDHDRGKATVTAAYVGILLFVICYTIAVLQGLTPRFFTQGVGPTGLRQAILGTALLLYVFSATLLVSFAIRRRSAFFFWYSLSLAMIALGIFGVFLQKDVGSPIGWLGRSAQYFGGILALAAVVTAWKEAKTRGLPLRAAIAGLFADAEASYEAVVETATNAIVSFDENGRIIAWNSAAERMFGPAKDEAVGADFFELVIAETSGQEVKSEIQSLTAPGTESSHGRILEIEAKGRDGNPFAAEISVSATRVAVGWLITCIVRDLTERKQAEEEIRALNEALEQRVAQRTRELVKANERLNREVEERKRTEQDLLESEQKFRLLFENSLDAILITAPQEGRVLAANPAACRMFVATEEEVCELGRDRFLASSDSELLTFMEERKRRGRIRMELTHRRNDGSLFPAEVSAALFRDAQGNERSSLVIRDITERRRVEDALRASEEKYRLIFANSPVAIFFFDTRSIVTDCNNAMVTLMGTTREKLIGLDLLASLANETVKGMIRDTLSGKSGHYEGEYLSVTGGKLTQVKASYAPLIADNGSLLGGIGIVEDVTERMQADKALRESESKYRMLIETMNEGLLVVDPQARLTYVNDNLAGMLGYSVQEMLGRSAFDFLHEPDREIVAEHFAKRRTGEVLAETYEVTLKHKDGRTVPVILAARGTFDQHNRFQGSVATCLDVGELKRAEEAQRRLAAAVHQSADSIAITGPDGRIQYVNPAFERISGYASEEVIGKTMALLKSDAQDQPFYQEMVKTIQRGDTWQGRLTSRRKDGTLFHEDVTISPVFDPSGAIRNYVDVAHDVTHRLQLEKQLLQAQKMEAIGTLAGGIAHDFNNLLQVTLGFSELLLAQKKEDDPEYADLMKVFQAAKNGAELVRRLLTFSRKLEPNPMPMNLNRQIVQVEKLLRRTIPRMIEIRLDLSPDLAEIYADPTQMEQVLMNLAVNARDAMPAGGTLTVETRNVLVDDEQCRLYVGAKPGESVLLAVSDTGHGIDKETLEHIFEPFYTTKQPGSGTGLGLAMVYGIVKQHDGYVTCSSIEGQGTTFSVYLPAIPQPEEVGVETSGIMPAFGTETVLVVDDEEFLRELGTRILTKAGYAVLLAASGKEALNVFRRERDRVSLVILDLIMPEMGGKECLQELRKIDPRARVLVTSGYSTDAAIKECMETGAKGFVSKPFRTKELLRQVRRALDRD